MLPIRVAVVEADGASGALEAENLRYMPQIFWISLQMNVPTIYSLVPDQLPDSDNTSLIYLLQDLCHFICSFALIL